MRIFLAGLGLTAAEIALSSEDIEKFKCRKNAWQLPQVYRALKAYYSVRDT